MSARGLKNLIVWSMHRQTEMENKTNKERNNQTRDVRSIQNMNMVCQNVANMLIMTTNRYQNVEHKLEKCWEQTRPTNINEVNTYKQKTNAWNYFFYLQY